MSWHRISTPALISLAIIIALCSSPEYSYSCFVSYEMLPLNSSIQADLGPPTVREYKFFLPDQGSVHLTITRISSNSFVPRMELYNSSCAKITLGDAVLDINEVLSPGVYYVLVFPDHHQFIDQSGTFKLTLSAIYPDYDGDGSPASQDCNDGNPHIYPGANEICNDKIDQDCNGVDKECAVIPEYLLLLGKN